MMQYIPWVNKNDINTLQLQINRHDAEIRALDEKQEAILNLLAGFSASIRNLQIGTDAAKAPAAYEEFREKTQSMPAGIEEINATQKIRDLEQELEECKKSLKFYEEQLPLEEKQELEKKSQELATQLNARARELQVAEQKIHSLKDEIDSRNQKIAELENTLAEDSQNHAEKIRQLEKQLRQKTDTLANAELQNRHLQAEIDSRNRNIADLKKTLLDRENEIGQIRNKFPELGQLMELKAMLENMGEEEKGLLAGYYDFSSITAFLTGLGQISRLEQLLDGCAGKIRAGSQLDNMARLLEIILHFYNQANPESQAAIFQCSPGDSYNYMEADRIGQNGRQVEKILLPGLRLPNGALSRKCLVTLH